MRHVQKEKSQLFDCIQHPSIKSKNVFEFENQRRKEMKNGGGKSPRLLSVGVSMVGMAPAVTSLGMVRMPESALPHSSHRLVQSDVMSLLFSSMRMKSREMRALPRQKCSPLALFNPEIPFHPPLALSIVNECACVCMRTQNGSNESNPSAS
jgi:hypothetical protein